MLSTGRIPYRTEVYTTVTGSFNARGLVKMNVVLSVCKQMLPPLFVSYISNVTRRTPPPLYFQTPTLAATTPATTSSSPSGREIARQRRRIGSRRRTPAVSTKARSGVTSSLAVPTWLWLPTVRSISTKQPLHHSLESSVLLCPCGCPISYIYFFLVS